MPFIRLVAESLRVEKFSLVDVGCSGGIESVWRLFADRFRAIGFDISVDACKQLADVEIQSDVHYVAGAVGIPPSHPFGQRVAGKPLESDPLSRRLSSTWAVEKNADRLRQASLDEKLQSNAWQMTQLADSEPVYLLDTFARLGFDDVDFLKIDVDGPDFRILNSLDGDLDRLGVLGVRLEVSMYGGTDDTAHTFHNTDRFMRRQGFELVDLDSRRYSLRALPARFSYAMPAQTESGRLYQAEAFYARDPVAAPALAGSLSAEKLAKLAAIFSVWGQPDGAAEILVTFRDRLAPLFDVDRGLDLLAAQMQEGNERLISYKDYVGTFARDETAFYPKPPPRPTLMQRLRAAWISLSDRAYIAKHEADRVGLKGSTLTQQAADRGEALAQFALGLAHQQGGADVPQDPVQARKWFALAAANASTPELRQAFTYCRDRFGASMSGAQVAEADKLAAGWRKGP